MIDRPIRALSIADFRRLEGHRSLPFDAPVVLLHGPNGTGKTSVLSALELALTGAVRSMKRQDPRYTAHLPTHGQDFATVRAEVAPELASGEPPRNLTVGGSRIEGNPALVPAAAQFYAERCYLDQVSLGQLLELYQYREGKEESALARFVNELLGLDQLDALRSGLADSTDVRNLRKLSDGFATAEEEANGASRRLADATQALNRVREEHERRRLELLRLLPELDGFVLGSINSDTGEVVEALLSSDAASKAGSDPDLLRRHMSVLQGRIEGLAARPSAIRLEAAKAAATQSAMAWAQWESTFGEPVAELRALIAELQIPSTAELATALEDEIGRIDAQLAGQEAAVAQLRLADERIDIWERTLASLEADVVDAERQAGSLATALATLRGRIVSDVCPVCDRDFGELGSGHLGDHLDSKLAALTEVGQRLQTLQRDRLALTAEIDRARSLRPSLLTKLLSKEQVEGVVARRSRVGEAQRSVVSLEVPIAEGEALRRRMRQSEDEVAELQAVGAEEQQIRAALRDVAEELELALPEPDAELARVWSFLAEELNTRVMAAREQSAIRKNCLDLAANVRDLTERSQSLQVEVAEAAKTKLLWDRRLAEVKRRQSVARQVHDAANRARASIVQQVFTESLNSVWRSVFTRLAPREPFVPAFGIPSSTKTALELRLETIHSSGEIGGPPQMMLSAGNLNTAALSLFIALHLAVDPLVPCLVFDDPVQSMDEIHIAQFAGLVRVLSKNHHRQVIIAVHERELFEYLALELSPAFEGDELITIELGDRSTDVDGGVNRLRWAPDPAIAV